MSGWKGLLQSKTFWGVVVSVAALVFGWSADTQAAVASQATELVTRLVELGGLALALYGRVKADTKIRGLFGKG